MDADEETAARKMAGRDTREPRVYGVAFWLVSAVWGTGFLLAGGTLTLTGIFSYSTIRSDGFSVEAIATSVGAAIFWSLIVVVATCYISIPIATLLTGGVRMMRRDISRWRREPQ